MIMKEKPHILGISEAELKKSHHCVNSLKVPGYDLLLPKSWEIYGKARVVVYIKKSLQYEHLLALEHADVQTLWLLRECWLSGRMLLLMTTLMNLMKYT